MRCMHACYMCSRHTPTDYTSSQVCSVLAMVAEGLTASKFCQRLCCMLLQQRDQYRWLRQGGWAPRRFQAFQATAAPNRLLEPESVGQEPILAAAGCVCSALIVKEIHRCRQTKSEHPEGVGGLQHGCEYLKSKSMCTSPCSCISLC